MRFWYLLLAAIAAVAVFHTNGCGGASNLPPDESGSNAGPDLSGLPQLPHGETDTRLAATFDGVSVKGSPPFDSANGTADGTALVLESGDMPSDFTAWAIYQLPEYPGGPVDMVTVYAQYLDPDPVTTRPEEGYWTAYADYNLGTWVFSGPHKTLQTRVNIPPEADAVSPGGFHYLLVLACQSNQAVVQRVQIGAYDGLDYETYTLGRPPGQSAGYACDIQLDPDGNPQIAYLVRPYLLSPEDEQLRVAKKAGDGWEIQDVPIPFEPKTFSFALGDGGRRALLVADRVSDDLWLLYDNNTGDFSDSKLISNSNVSSVQASVTFVNSMDDSTKPLNLAVVVYAKPALGDEVDTYSRSYSGGILSPDLLIHPTSTVRPARLEVTTTPDKLAMVAVPNKVAGKWYCDTSLLMGGAWSFAGIPGWGPLDSFDEFDDSTPDVVVRAAPTGDLIGCYMRYPLTTVGMARFDGILWLTTEEDVLFAGLKEPIDLDAFGSGRTVFMSRYGDMKPLLRWGLAGAGEVYSQQYIETEPFAASNCTFAVDSSNNTHIAAYNGFQGKLAYYLRPAAGPITVETVDTGGPASGGTRAFVQLVYVNDNLHVFYVDAAHPALLHSENANGIWTVENEVIEDRGLPNSVFGAGYLENLDLLYVCYLDYYDRQVYLLSGTPEGHDWRRQPVGLSDTEFVHVADNGTEVGLATVQPSPLTDGRIVFNIGEPGEAVWDSETISQHAPLVGYPAGDLAYSPHDDVWGFATHFSQELGYLRRTAPGNWEGPYTVAKVPGVGAYVIAEGLTYVEADGTPRLLAMQQDAGDPKLKLNVYSASPGGTDFSYMGTIESVTNATEQMSYIRVIEGLGGEPTVAVCHKLLVDATWDIDLIGSDGPGSWALHETWDSPLVQPFPALAIRSDGQPAVASIEHDVSSPANGSVIVHYPW